ncbi:MAG: hypothetical protein JNL67_22525 [Planctomycetaceae bacterium]|nr:hypothetical protein [Planctomycetaceae bacterium]
MHGMNGRRLDVLSLDRNVWLAFMAWLGLMLGNSITRAQDASVSSNATSILSNIDDTQDGTESEQLTWKAEDPAQDRIWEFKDVNGWRFVDSDGERVMSQFQKNSDYQPPHRSPLHIALLRERKYESFEMDVWVKSTHAEYGHRDVCLFFGYEAPDRFYYVHLASEMDDRANQIFLVNRADREKISTRTTNGTKWDSSWHQIRVIRHSGTGEIAVYFDDMTKPIMQAVDRSIGLGQIGVGSFDDTADFQRLEIRPLPLSSNPVESKNVDRH